MTSLEKPKVTSLYGWRTLNGVRQFHNGIDMVNTDGSRTVRAIWAGRCEIVKGYNGGRGNTVYLYYNNTLRVLEQHLDSFNVAQGQTVKQGQFIGQYGNTGDSYGAHLHEEVQKLQGGRWVAIAPMEYTEIKNQLGVQPGNNNIDGKPNPDPVKPVGNTVVLQVGPMSPGDKNTMESLAANLALGCAVAKTNGQETTLHIGPMTAGDRATVEAEAKRLVIPCRVWDSTQVLAIGPCSPGDARAVEKKANEYRVTVSTKDAGKGLYMQTVGPMTAEVAKVFKDLAASLFLPVGVA